MLQKVPENHVLRFRFHSLCEVFHTLLFQVIIDTALVYGVPYYKIKMCVHECVFKTHISVLNRVPPVYHKRYMIHGISIEPSCFRMLCLTQLPFLPTIFRLIFIFIFTIDYQKV